MLVGLIEAIRPTAERVRSVLFRRWLVVLIALAIFAQISGFIFAYRASSFPIFADSALFEHAGWYMTQGGIPYVDFWDLNPPLMFYLSAVLALVFGESPPVMHFVSGAVSAFAVVGAVAMLGLLGYELSNSRQIGFISGFGLLLLPGMYGLPPYVFHPEYFFLLFGITGLYLIERDHPGAAGVAIALAAGFYQPGAILALIGLGRSAQLRAREGVVWYCLGGFVVALGTLLPLLYWGALEAAITETVLVSVMTQTGGSVEVRLAQLWKALGWGTVGILIGGIGWTKAIQEDLQRYWWVAATGSLFLLKAVFVDLESPLDIFMLIAFTSLGLALAFHFINRPDLGTFVIVVLVITGVFWAANPGDIMPLKPDIQSGENDSEVSGSYTNATELFINKEYPPTCHYWMSSREQQWLNKTGRTVESPCGKWPS